MNKTQSTFVAFLAGAAAGAIAGILLAPDSGKNTRDKLSQATLDLKDQIGTRITDEFSKLKDVKDKAFSDIKKGVRTGTEQVTENQPKY